LGGEDLAAGFAPEFLGAAAIGAEADDRFGLLTMRARNSNHEAIIHHNAYKSNAHLAYRYLDTDYRKDDFVFDTHLDGPLLGVTFKL
jgi:hypothetical protein